MNDNQQKRKRKIYKRKVIFGNPTLGGTYSGHVCTYSKEPTTSISSNGTDDDIDDSMNMFQHMVAITDVPPDQIPEGLLNLARRHKSSIEHIRVLISVDDNENDDKNNDGDENDNIDKNDKTGGKRDNMKNNQGVQNQIMKFKTFDEKEDCHSQNERNNNDANHPSQNKQDHHHHQQQHQQQKRKKKYLILISLRSSKAADLFVKYINGKPYNSFESDVIAYVHHVASVVLDGHGGYDHNDTTTIENDTEDEKIDDDNDYNNTNHENSPSKSSSNEKNNNIIGDTTTTNGRTQNSNLFFNNNTKSEYKKSSPNHKKHPNHHNHHPIKRVKSFEKQNCAVCLESMEFHSLSMMKKQSSATTCVSATTNNSINSNNNNTSPTNKMNSLSSIFTTVCNHSFHTECLLRCEDSPCPVCRYDHTGLNDTLSQCHFCGTTENIHVCLICGVASCWNKHRVVQAEEEIQREGGVRVEEYTIQNNPCQMSGCARQHYDETLHAYALDTETQHVWDFAGQGYVHRLIQNVDDGKIVEVSDPNSGEMERSLIPELTDTQESEVVHRKLEGYASQYCTLLKSQLEQQRVYYEGVMEKIRRDYKAKVDDGDCLSEWISALKQDRNQLQQRYHVLRKKRDKVADDASFLKNMNESLIASKAPMRREIRNLQRQQSEAKKMRERCIPALEEKLSSLMLELEKDLS